MTTPRALLAALVALAFAPSINAQTFGFTGGGAIPDAAPGTPGTFAAPLTMTATSTVAGTIQDVVATVTLTHTWVGDLRARLSYTPSGSATTTTITLFNRTGATTTTSVGSSSNLNGTYTFVFAGSNLWNTAGGLGDGGNIPGGVYQPFTNALNGSHPEYELANVYRNLPGNGTWTLQVDDCDNADTGTVTAATVTITTRTPQCMMDLNHDGQINVADLTQFLVQFGRTCP